MQLYRFSPIENKAKLEEAIKHIHFSCHKLCKQSFGRYFSNAGNMGVFCHYDQEYELLIKIREELTEPSNNANQKYYRLHQPFIVPAKGDVPETTYTYLYIRKPDPYRHHVGDIDFFLEPEKYAELKQSILAGKPIKGVRIFPRPDLDMVELYDPDIDTLTYVSTNTMTEKARIRTN